MIIEKENKSHQFSMKKKIIVNSLIGSLALFLTIGLLGSFYLIKWLNKEFDASLGAKARGMTALVRSSDDGVVFDYDDEFMPEFRNTENAEYFQLWRDSNHVLFKSNSLSQLNQESNLPVTVFRSRRERFNNITLPDGREGRMVSLSFNPQNQNRDDDPDYVAAVSPLVTLAVARERESLDDTIRDFLLVFTAIVVLFTLLAALTIWQSVSKGLMPLKNMQRKMSVLAADNLSERLVIPSTPKELEETVDAFNLMLDRLEFSFEREKRFTSDVAHELRAPISEMRNLAEVAMKSKQAEGGWTPYQDILDSAMQMQITVANLMALARCEKGNIILEPQVIKLASKLETCWLRHMDIANKRSIKLDNQIEDSFKIISSSAELDIIFNNLISNAVTYSVEGSTVTMSCKTENDILCIFVTNTPKDLAPEDLDKMFERMWQKNSSSDLSGHAGLGMALVKSYADLLNLKVSTSLSEQGQLTIELCGFYQDH